MIASERDAKRVAPPASVAVTTPPSVAASAPAAPGSLPLDPSSSPESADYVSGAAQAPWRSPDGVVDVLLPPGSTTDLRNDDRYIGAVSYLGQYAVGVVEYTYPPGAIPPDYAKRVMFATDFEVNVIGGFRSDLQVLRAEHLPTGEFYVETSEVLSANGIDAARTAGIMLTETRVVVVYVYGQYPQPEVFDVLSHSLRVDGHGL